jgi:hypothetical protein
MAVMMVVWLWLPAGAFSQEQKQEPQGGALRVVRDVVTTGVANREPADSATVFPPSVGALYYFTEIEGASTPTRITHVWYYNEQRIAEVTLDVQEGRWRTWSRKRLLQNWIGPWRVEAVDPDGRVLSSQIFDVH